MNGIFTLRKNRNYVLLLLLFISSGCSYYYSLFEKDSIKMDKINQNSNINDFKWRNRLLIYSEFNFINIDEYKADLNDYDLLIFNIKDNYIYNEDIKIKLNHFFENSNLNINDFLNDIALLIGKDGKVKAKYVQPFKLSEVLIKIDSMPMRILENKNLKKAR